MYVCLRIMYILFIDMYMWDTCTTCLDSFGHETHGNSKIKTDHLCRGFTTETVQISRKGLRWSRWRPNNMVYLYIYKMIQCIYTMDDYWMICGWLMDDQWMISGWTLWLFNIAKWKIPQKWRFLAGKIIYFYRPCSMAMLNNQRVYIHIHKMTLYNICI